MQTWVRTIGFLRYDSHYEVYEFWPRNCYMPLLSATTVLRCDTLDDFEESSSQPIEGFMHEIVSGIHKLFSGLSADCKCNTIKQMTKDAWHDEDAPKCAMMPSNSKCVMPCELHTKYAPYYFARIPCDDNDQRFLDQDTFVWYLIHPDERERMERILNGTDNPLYDLVHQLMYNPDVLPAEMIRSRREAKEHFEEQKKRKIE